MIQILKHPSESSQEKVKSITERGLAFDAALVEQVGAILEAVRTGGDEAMIRYINRFDAPDMTIDGLRVTDEEFTAAENSVKPAFRDALRRATDQVGAFHRKQVRKSWMSMDRPGTFLGQLFNPVEAAGVYVPGGTGGSTPLVSSVLMGVIPARIAGVDKVIMATPPRKDGGIDPHLLVAARTAGADAVYKTGSAWAVGAMAYGTETIPRCDVIVGPGNVYVTIAKKLVSGTVGIDMIAGPSEILVVADESADPEFVAADMLSQAEHDPLASSILVTPSEDLAKSVATALDNRLARLKRKEIAEKSLRDFGAILIVPDLNAGIDLANRIAPEHLELQVAAPFEVLGNIRNAGAVFMGPYTPEPVGDYVAGPNHVLPTGGTARFSSALSVDHFVKRTSVIQYSKEAFLEEAEDIMQLADIEGLGAHAESVRVRLE